jgi:tripartite-type tricarboxylate transporter receptor subunit TctC
MQITRFVRSTVLCIAAAIAATLSQAQSFSTRPIRILVGFAPGGATDLIARLYAQHLKDALNTPVIVENKVGASELVAIRALMSSPPDGNTFWLAAGSSLTMGPAIREDLPYDISKDFTQIGLVATAPGVFFVHPSLPVRTLSELISYAKANPGKLNYGSAGIGSSSHLQMEYFLKASGISMTHIPYKATNESVQAVGGGYVHMGLAPAKLPTDIVVKINSAINKVAVIPEVAERMREVFSAEPTISTPVSYRQFVEKELAKWQEISKSLKTETGN